MFDTKFLKHFFLKLNVRFCVTFIEYINRSSFSSRVFILVFECPTVAKKIMIFFVIVELLKKLVTQQVKDFILVFECPTVMIFFVIVELLKKTSDSTSQRFSSPLTRNNVH